MKQKIIFLTIMLFAPILAVAICNDNPDSDVYTGNQGSYSDTGETQVLMESGCSEQRIIFFPYCEAGEVKESFFSCKCLNGRCIAKNADVYYMIEHLGESTTALKGGLISSNILYSSIDSWIDN